jgi:hypothetical protein
MDLKLDRLLNKAGISQYDRHVWFEGSRLTGHVLQVPDADLAASITRCWLPRLKLIVRDCVVMVAKSAPAKVNDGFKPARSGDLW